MSKIKKTKKYVSHDDGLMERLKDPEYASLYLNELLEDHAKDSEQFFLDGLRDVAKAHGFSHLAAQTKLGRESMYKALSKNGNPRLSTLALVLDAAGLKLSVEPKKVAS
jgi:probable addiction module antidote protein